MYAHYNNFAEKRSCNGFKRYNIHKWTYLDMWTEFQRLPYLGIMLSNYVNLDQDFNSIFFVSRDLLNELLHFEADESPVHPALLVRNLLFQSVPIDTGAPLYRF